jgi:O-antigen/teichoic acid export membrane protein
MKQEHSIARRVAGGTAANVAGQTVVVLSRIALVPVIVHAVGVTDFGVWVVVGSVASFAFLLDLGMSTALVKYVAEHRAREEAEESRLMLGAATSLYGLLGVALSVLGLLIAIALASVFHLGPDHGRLAAWLVAVTAIDVGISLVAAAPTATLKGLQRFAAVNALTVVGALAGVALTVGVLWAGGGIVGVAAVAAFNSAAMYAVSVVAVRRLAPGYIGPLVRWDRARIGRLLRFSRSIAVIQVAIRMQGRLDVIVIAAALPVRMVTPYNFAQRLADGTRIATDQFGKVILPLATEVSATRERSVLRQLFLTTTRLTLVIAIGVGLPLALLGGSILSIWVGDAFADYHALVAILACAAIVDLPSYPAAAVLQSIERHGPIAWMALASGAANVFLSIALVGPYGVEGVAFATLLASGVEIVCFVLPYAARELGISIKEFLSEVVLRLVLPVAFFAALIVGANALVPATSLIRLIAVVGAALIGYIVVYMALCAPRAERAAYYSGVAVAVRLAWPFVHRSEAKAALPETDCMSFGSAPAEEKQRERPTPRAVPPSRDKVD